MDSKLLQLLSLRAYPPFRWDTAGLGEEKPQHRIGLDTNL